MCWQLELNYNTPEIAAVTQQKPVFTISSPTHFTECVVGYRLLINVHFTVSDRDTSVNDALTAITHQDQTKHLTIHRTRVYILKHFHTTNCQLCN